MLWVLLLSIRRHGVTVDTNNKTRLPLCNILQYYRSKLFQGNKTTFHEACSFDKPKLLRCSKGGSLYPPRLVDDVVDIRAIIIQRFLGHCEMHDGEPRVFNILNEKLRLTFPTFQRWVIKTTRFGFSARLSVIRRGGVV